MAENEKNEETPKEEEKATKQRRSRKSSEEKENTPRGEGGGVRRSAVEEDETPLVDETKEFETREKRQRAATLRGNAGVARPTDDKGKDLYVGYRPIVPRSDEPNTRGDVDTNMFDGMPVRVQKPNPVFGANDIDKPETRLADPGSQTMAQKEASNPHLGLKKWRGVPGAKAL